MTERSAYVDFSAEKKLLWHSSGGKGWPGSGGEAPVGVGAEVEEDTRTFDVGWGSRVRGGDKLVSKLILALIAWVLLRLSHGVTGVLPEVKCQMTNDHSRDWQLFWGRQPLG